MARNRFFPRRGGSAFGPALAGLFLITGVPGASAREGGPAPHDAPAPHAASAGPGATAMHAGHHADMTDADMKSMLAAWFAAHPASGVASLAPAAAVVKVQNFIFNADNNTATTIDTVKIAPGETVTWQWVNGGHTVTSGTGSGDPEAGADFNQTIDFATTSFSFAFPNPGVYPYFCAIHELTMRGFVKVGSTSGVTPIPLPEKRTGFLSSPTPNPTRAGARFQFAVADRGRVRVHVFDVKGQIVATPVDRDLDAGGYAVSWDGLTSEGGAARAGVYFIHLTGPGIRESRTLIISR